MVKAFLLFDSVGLGECRSWEGCPEICEVGVSGPAQEQVLPVKLSPAQTVSGSRLGAAAEEEQLITGMGR